MFKGALGLEVEKDSKTSNILFYKAFKMLINLNFSTHFLDVVIGFVNINGTNYYVDSENYYFPTETRELCDSLNMTLVSFETEEEWNNVLAWIANSG